MISAICTTVQAMAGDLISGAQLKDHVQSVLMSRGLNSRPVISDTRRFRACEAPLQVTPMFGGYKTVCLTCPDVDGFKIAVHQIDSFADATETAQRGRGWTQICCNYKKPADRRNYWADDVSLVSRDFNPGVGYFRDINDVAVAKQPSILIKSFVPGIQSLIMPSRKTVCDYRVKNWP